MDYVKRIPQSLVMLTTSHNLFSLFGMATGGDYQHKLNIWPLPQNEVRRVEHRRQDVHEFLSATARQQGNDRSCRIETVTAAELFAIAAGANFTNQRMAHVFDVGHAAPVVPFFFERQDRQQQIDVAPQRARAI